MQEKQKILLKYMASWSCLTITHNVKYLNQMLNNHLIPSLIHFSVTTKHPKLHSISLNSYFCFKLRANRGLYCCSQKERQGEKNLKLYPYNLYQSFLCLSNCGHPSPGTSLFVGWLPKSPYYLFSTLPHHNWSL